MSGPIRITKSALEKSVGFDINSAVFSKAMVGGKERDIVFLTAHIKLAGQKELYEWNVVTTLDNSSKNPEKEAILRLSATALKVAKCANSEEADKLIFEDNHGMHRYGVKDNDINAKGTESADVFLATRSDIAPGTLNWYVGKRFNDSKVEFDEELLESVNRIARDLQIARSKELKDKAGDPAVHLRPVIDPES